MNTKEVTAILRNDLLARRQFCGVYPRNKLPMLPAITKPSTYVINTDSSRGVGEHWVAVYFNGRGKAEYFDSFGFPPMHSDIKSFILKHCNNYLYNKRLIQDLTSSMCGVYAVYYVLMKSRGVSMSRALSRFHPYKLQSNDRKVWVLVQQLQKKKKNE